MASSTAAGPQRWPWIQVAQSLALVAAGAILVIEKDAPGPGNLAVGQDSESYALMADGRWDEAAAPFRYRVLAPLVAGALPLAPGDGLRAVTYASLAALYFLLLDLGRRAGLPPTAGFLGLLAVWSYATHLYNYYNPFLVDAPGLAVVAFVIWTAARRDRPWFAVAVVAGALVRETTVALALLWVARGPLRKTLPFAAGVGVAAAASHLATRVLLVDGPAIDYFDNPFDNPWLLLLLPMAWGPAWAVGLVGLLAVPRAVAGVVGAATLLLAATAAASSFFATDIIRMLVPLFPILALGAMAFFDRTLAASRPLAGALAAWLAAGLFLGVPTVVFPNVVGLRSGPPLWLVTAYVAVFLALGTACILAARAGWLEAWREKQADLQELARRVRRRSA